ncbi:MAG: hypothetical protein HKP61_00265 [Dactylosporangium sp.]|nr:hypothetical protein [Dactylosporangium sp.]NNJ59406.1 hypothetical protein [Dactylosporangium sp.]
MVDPRAKHLKRVRRLRRSARGWSVRAGLLFGATAVLVPYQGLGLADAIWAAAAGGSLAIAGWRWVDFRGFAQLPVPPPVSPEIAAAETRAKMIDVVSRLPIGHTVITELRRQRTQHRMRGLSVSVLWRRLDRAAVTLAGLRDRLTGPAVSAVADAAEAERALRDLADRVASVERATRTVAGRGTPALAEAHTALSTQLSEGVSAYEHLVMASAAYVAEDVRLPGTSPAVSGLSEAAEMLRCVAESMSELRKTAPS